MSAKYSILFSVNFFCYVSFLLISQVMSQNSVQDNGAFCDPLRADGTNLLCTAPVGRKVALDCSRPSIPGTVASYACRNPRGEVLRGLLNCTTDGYWISSMRSANTSLCNLEASIINVQSPDVAVSVGSPGFTTPKPDKQLTQLDAFVLNDYQLMAVQLHNTFRRNHGVPFVVGVPLMNEVAQDLADYIGSGKSTDVPTSKKLSLVNVTSNIEMNWYLQQPVASNNVEAVSNAVQSWYSSGFPEYDWDTVGNNLDTAEVISFSRVIWKSTKFIGIGVSNFNGVTFVAAIYTPGRHIGNTDPIQDFRENVMPVRVG